MRNGTVTATALAAGALFALRAAIRSSRRLDLTDRCILITGGSRGLGLELAREFVRRRARVVLLARTEEDLERAQRDVESIGAGKVSVVRCDVTNHESVEVAVAETVGMHGGVDVLVNNAGIIQVGPFEQMTLDDFEQTMRTHFWGPLYAMLAVIPIMRSQGHGRIVNIASIGGKVAVPHLVPYTASKFALVGLSDGMRAELAKYGIRVTTVSPGLMRTGSHVNVSIKGQNEKEFAWFSVIQANPLASIDATRAAKRIVNACVHGRAALDLSIPARILILADAISPSLFGEATALINRFLPAPTFQTATPKTGWESQSEWTPSTLTRLSDRAVLRNNELRGHSPSELSINTEARRHGVNK